MPEEVPEEGKSPFSSKTIHVNALISILVHIIWPRLPKNHPELMELIPYLTDIITLANIALRFVTCEALKVWTKKT